MIRLNYAGGTVDSGHLTVLPKPRPSCFTAIRRHCPLSDIRDRLSDCTQPARKGSMTSGIATYVLIVSVVLGINLLPALGPPTWSVLVLFRLHEHVSAPLLVVFGAIAAGAGRLASLWSPDGSGDGCRHVASTTSARLARTSLDIAAGQFSAWASSRCHRFLQHSCSKQPAFSTCLSCQSLWPSSAAGWSATPSTSALRG